MEWTAETVIRLGAMPNPTVMLWGGFPVWRRVACCGVDVGHVWSEMGGRII